MENVVADFAGIPTLEDQEINDQTSETETELTEEVTETLVEVTYNGKTTNKVQIVPGIVKYGEAYLIICSVTGEWFYCNQPRLNKLVAKKGSEEAVGTSYLSRKGAKIQKEG